MVTIIPAGGGAAISFDEVGDPAGFPVVFHNGTPCSRLLPDWWDSLAKARGLRIVCFDRPGYGNWPAQPGRTVLDVVAATARAADMLGIDRFVSWGASGGVPFAIGCAAVLGERVPAVVVVGGGAPNDGSPDWLPEWARDASPEDIERGFRPALAGDRPAVAEAVQQSAAELRGFDVPGWLEAWSDVFSPADKRALDAKMAGFLLGNIQEALRPGIEGWVDDQIAWAQPWGIDVAAVRQPAAIWHGEEDRMKTPADARLLAAQIPHAVLFMVEGQGHPSLIYRHVEPTMDWISQHVASA
jgi:pimeloyl-ACP methyl ester carboxylesterase